MSNKNFKVRHGLDVGPLNIDAATGIISVSGGGSLNLSSGFDVSGNIEITGGSINATVIGNVTPAAATFTTANATTFTGSLSGNASTASALQTARNISLTGDATGTVSFDGTQDVNISMSLSSTGVSSGTYTKVTVDGKGRVTSATNATTTDIAEGTNLYYTTARFDSAFSTKTTDNLTQGSTNKYFTNAAARGAISVSGSLSYNSTTGVISYTESVSSVAGKNGAVVLAAGDITSGTFADARISSSSVVQHQANLTIAESQISDGTIYPRIAGSETITGNWSFSNPLAVGAPSSSNHAATKNYVDNVAQGLSTKPAVEIATTGNLSATYNNGTAGVGATLTATSNGAFPTIDGVTLTSTTLGLNGVLVKNQTNAAENGRYNLTQVGDSSNPWILTRCGLCDEASEIPGSYVFVKQGTQYAGTGWVQIVANPNTFTVGTDAINVQQFGGSAIYTAGAGLTLNGTELNIETASSSRIVVNADNIDLATVGNSNTGSFVKVTVDSYGRVTGTTGVTASDVTSVINGSSLAIADGTAATPGLSFANDTNNGLYRVTTDTIAFATTGTERLRFNEVGAWGLSGANYGTAGQVLTSNGTSSAPTWETATASSLLGGATGQIPYQSNVGVTSFSSGLNWNNSNLELQIGTSGSLDTGRLVLGGTQGSGVITVQANANLLTLETPEAGAPAEIKIQPGNSTSTGSSAALSLVGGSCSVASTSGAVFITGGSNTSTGTGGSVYITGGTGTNATGGQIIMRTASTGTSTVDRVTIANNGTVTILNDLVMSQGFVRSSVNTGVSAAGTTQSTATLISRNISVVTVVSPGAGVRFPSAPGACFIVINISPNSLNVYPASGAEIDSLGTDIAYSLPVGGRVMFVQVSTTQYYTMNATYA